MLVKRSGCKVVLFRLDTFLLVFALHCIDKASTKSHLQRASGSCIIDTNHRP
jgi:hypothetical protein